MITLLINCNKAMPHLQCNVCVLLRHKHYNGIARSKLVLVRWILILYNTFKYSFTKLDVHEFKPKFIAMVIRFATKTSIHPSMNSIQAVTDLVNEFSRIFTHVAFLKWCIRYTKLMLSWLAIIFGWSLKEWWCFKK